MGRENEQLIVKHDEEMRDSCEKFLIFIKICKIFIKKIKNIFSIFSILEEKKIRTIIDQKNNVFKDINLILDEFDSTINNPEVLSDLKKTEMDYKLIDVLEKYENEDFSKIFNFIDVIARLEFENKRNIEYNNMISKKIKNEVIIIRQMFFKIKIDNK